MKRAKKSFWFLAGILLLLGFCFREDVLASSLTSLPSLSKAGIGEVVSSDSVIDGRYDFTPLIGSETKIRFGSTDGSTWDNLFCKNGESHSKCCSTWCGIYECWRVPRGKCNDADLAGRLAEHGCTIRV